MCAVSDSLVQEKKNTDWGNTGLADLRNKTFVFFLKTTSLCNLNAIAKPGILPSKNFKGQETGEESRVEKPLTDSGDNSPSKEKG